MIYISYKLIGTVQMNDIFCDKNLFKIILFPSNVYRIPKLDQIFRITVFFRLYPLNEIPQQPTKSQTDL